MTVEGKIQNSMLKTKMEIIIKQWVASLLLAIKISNTLLGPEYLKKKKVSFLSHSGTTREDLTDYAELSIREKSDVIIAHTGTNDFTKRVNTIKKVKKVAESIKELERDESIKIGLSSIINRDDVDKRNDAKKVNNL